MNNFFFIKKFYKGIIYCNMLCILPITFISKFLLYFYTKFKKHLLKQKELTNYYKTYSNDITMYSYIMF